MSDTTNNEPADSDEVLHHVTVADVETLHDMVLTEHHVELVKARLAQALTDAINEIRGVSDLTGGTHVLVTGNPTEGFRFIGPVTPNDPDLEHYTDIDPKPDYWWYADLTPLHTPAPVPATLLLNELRDLIESEEVAEDGSYASQIVAKFKEFDAATRR